VGWRNVMPAVADAKAFLRKTNADGVSVYSHLTEVLATLLDQKPDNALDALEGVSLACKQKHYIPALAVVPQPPPELGSVSHGEHWHMANVAILTPPKAGEEPAEQGVVTDVLSERALFEWCAAAMAPTAAASGTGLTAISAAATTAAGQPLRRCCNGRCGEHDLPAARCCHTPATRAAHPRAERGCCALSHPSLLLARSLTVLHLARAFVRSLAVRASA
jgi:hypothetical protein